MTEKLYHSSLKSCESRVLSCRENNGVWEVLLDKTVIFPEGGGQPADTGHIGNAAVLDAQEDGDDVIHILDRPLTVGGTYTVSFDTERRRDHSEQHTGEHILSGTAFRLFEAKNVGFHMAEDYCTLDLDKYLDADALTELEKAANEAVRRNVPVTARVMDRAEFNTISIRKKSEVKSDEIRVVYIGGGEVDSCTCCGTHCNTSGEVGYIRITDSQKYKGGTRIWFSCGSRAVKEANAVTRLLTELARSYSTGRDELPAAVRKQSEELAMLKRELKARTQALCDMLAEKNTSAFAVVRIEGFSANDVKMLSETLIAHGAKAALVFGITDGVTHYRAVRAKDTSLNMNEIIKAVNALLNGKGGGSPLFAQGSAQKSLDSESFGSIKAYAEKLAMNEL